MANALKGEVALPFGGASYTLAYDIDALCAAEDALDLPVDEILVRLNATRKRIGVVRAVLWAGLRAHHPDLTIEMVGQRFLTPGGLGTGGAFAFIAEALGKAFPKPDAEAATGTTDPQPAEPGIGTASSGSGAN